MKNALHHQESLRNGRYIESGLFYFLTSVTKDRTPFFLKPHAALTVLDTLKWLDEKDRIRLVVAVVMPDHLHFIAQLKEKTLSWVMHSLKSYTANEINKILGRRGHVWERQYYESGIRCEKALNEKVEYCLRNTERRGLVEDFREYPYWYCRYEVWSRQDGAPKAWAELGLLQEQLPFDPSSGQHSGQTGRYNQVAPLNSHKNYCALANKTFIYYWVVYIISKRPSANSLNV